MRRVISLLLLLSLPISVIAGSDNYSMNFVIPTDTQNPGGGGGGGGGITLDDIYEIGKRTSPPLVSVRDMGDGKALITVQNEGIESQEYTISWNLKNSLGFMMDSFVESKLLKPTEKYEIPLSFELDTGELYSVEVVVQYGLRQSKAATILRIVEKGFQTQLIPIAKQNSEYLILFVGGLIVVAVLRQKMKFRVRK